MWINGKHFERSTEQTILDVLMVRGYTLDAVVVEHNGEILTKEQFAKTVVNDEDVLEVVSFVGGG